MREVLQVVLVIVGSALLVILLAVPILRSVGWLANKIKPRKRINPLVEISFVKANYWEACGAKMIKTIEDTRYNTISGEIVAHLSQYKCPHWRKWYRQNHTKFSSWNQSKNVTKENQTHE